MSRFGSCGKPSFSLRYGESILTHTRTDLRSCPCCFLPASAASSYITITEAAKHIGANKCVIGKVVRVKQGNRGTHFFDFCEDYRTCPFTVVVFSSDLKQVGDVRNLEGRLIEIDGEIKSYDGRAEIILHRASRRGDAAHIPPLPKQYDVERKGKFSAGTFANPKQSERPTQEGIVAGIVRRPQFA